MPPRRVVILRHGEKPGDLRDSDLSPAGEQRAEMLATLIPQTFGDPQFLFAAAESKHSDRPVETLTPLARKLGLDIKDSLSDENYPVLADDLLRKPKYEEKLVIVCWHHGYIPELAVALGVPESKLVNTPGLTGLKWQEGVFDRFWVLDFQGGAVAFQNTPQTPANPAPGK